MKTETMCRKQLFRESILRNGNLEMNPTTPSTTLKNSTLYEQYKALAEAEDNVIFGGRLGEYKYYDMDKTIEVAPRRSKERTLLNY